MSETKIQPEDLEFNNVQENAFFQSFKSGEDRHDTYVIPSRPDRPERLREICGSWLCIVMHSYALSNEHSLALSN